MAEGGARGLIHFSGENAAGRYTVKFTRMKKPGRALRARGET
jgi:hypothetical protein